MPSLSFGLLDHRISKFVDLKAVLGIEDGKWANLFLFFSNGYINSCLNRACARDGGKQREALTFFMISTNMSIHRFIFRGFA